MKNQVEKVKAAGHELVSVYWDYCSAFLQSGEYLRSTGQYIYIYEISFARFKSNGLKANKYCIYGVQISVTKTSLSLGHLTSISSNAAVLSHINVFVLHDSAGHWNFIQESFSWATERLYLSEGWKDCHLISS